LLACSCVVSFCFVLGFYISTYKTSSGATKKIASTKFESSYARQAFPCFDEPAFKANFSIAITTEAYHRTILSNMPNTTAPVLVDGSAAWQRVAFDTTPRMSTYLVAYVICDFAYVEALTARGVPVRVWTDVEKISFTAAALKAGVDSLNRYEQFFKLPYPLPKSDQVAIPDFASGAMEVRTTHTPAHASNTGNCIVLQSLIIVCVSVCLSLLCLLQNWGLVTYRETSLLVSDDSREANSEQTAVKTVAHELAHQWFGDIVTMEWWDGQWILRVAKYMRRVWCLVSMSFVSHSLSSFTFFAAQFSSVVCHFQVCG
jgi:aminopeptidase N